MDEVSDDIAKLVVFEDEESQVAEPPSNPPSQGIKTGGSSKSKLYKWVSRLETRANIHAEKIVQGPSQVPSPRPAIQSQKVSGELLIAPTSSKISTSATQDEGCNTRHARETCDFSETKLDIMAPVKSKLSNMPPSPPAEPAKVTVPQAQQENWSKPAEVSTIGSKAAHWAARAAVGSAAHVAVPELAPVPAHAPVSTAGASKAARWAARAMGQTGMSQATASTAGGDLQTLQTVQTTVLVPGSAAASEYPQPHPPVPGSAMEAWMVRATAKQLHLPWQDKFRDYADEGYMHNVGLSEQDILAHRRHLNPPDIQRLYSSIRKHDEVASITGLGWARGCLDSNAAWCPATNNTGQWMELDLLQDTEIFGIITQGQAATCCSGQRFVCVRKCPPPHGCKGGGEQNFSTIVQVKYRLDLACDFKTIPENLKIGKGGETRRETMFPFSVRARYVRILVMRATNNVALRAGVLVGERNHLFERSCFSLRNSKESSCALSVSTLAPVATVAIARDSGVSSPAASAAPTASSKAARWAARALGLPRHETLDVAANPATPTAESAREGGVGGVGEAAGSGKAARWASRAAGRAPAANVIVAEHIVALPSGEAAAAAAAAEGARAGGKAARWAARASGTHTCLPPEPPTTAAPPVPTPAPVVAQQGTPKESGEDGAEVEYAMLNTPSMMYSGMVRDGVPDGFGRMLMSDGTEFHGNLAKGNPHGFGGYYFPDKSKLEVKFENGMPIGKGRLIERSGQHWDVEYDGSLALHQGGEPVKKTETYPEAFEEVTVDCVAISIGKPFEARRPDGSMGLKGLYPNLPPNHNLVGKLVWARPQYAEVPLWNAADCGNSIVVIVMGPARQPKCIVSMSLKIHHAQQAGAKGVVLVDPYRRGFDHIPAALEGPITEGVTPNPPDFDIKITIPTVMVLKEKAMKMREGAIHMFRYYDEKQIAGIPFGMKVGCVHLPKQESRVGLQKSKAEALMADFFSARRQERAEETQMLTEDKRCGKDLSEETLKSQEFYGGSFLESMNPFKKVKGTETLDNRVQRGMMQKISSMPVVGDLQRRFSVKMQKVRQDIEVALPVHVMWNTEDEDGHDDDALPKDSEAAQSSYSMASLQKAAGFKLPTIMPKDPRGNFGWSVYGEAPFKVCFRLTSGADRPLILDVEPSDPSDMDTEYVLRLYQRKDGKLSDVTQVKLGFTDYKQQKVGLQVSVDSRGFHVFITTLVQFKGKGTLFAHKDGDLETLSIDKLATLPLVQYATKYGKFKYQLKVPKILRLAPDEGLYVPLPAPKFHYQLEDWTLVFRQTAPFEYSRDNDWQQAKLWNQNDPNSDNYSILQDLENHRCSDHQFNMLLRWPLDAPEAANIFRQSSNPVLEEEMGVNNYTPVRIDFERSCFGGLQKTDTRIKNNGSCFLDGSVDHYEVWAFAIGVDALYNKTIPGPNGAPAKQVELWVTTKDVGIANEAVVAAGNTAPNNPYCEHGKLKSTANCPQCKDPLTGHLMVDHNPYYPCTSGHGARWLWDASGRGRNRKTFNSKSFFQQLDQNDERAFSKEKWPLLYSPDHEQHACSGYHTFCIGDSFHFIGWLVNGLPEGLCSVRWADGSEYHGEFADGEMLGYGRYIFADGLEFRGDFKNGIPGHGLLYPADDIRRLADYEYSSPETPLWNMLPHQLIHQEMIEMPVPRFLWTKADCLAAVKAVPGTGPDGHTFLHISTVTAQLVWARPIYADQPLWNAAECRGKIVAILRGPKAPAPPCNYSIKLYHAQEAGAVGVIFVDYDSFAAFTVVPRVENGPICRGGPILAVRIPCFLTLNKLAGVLQEGASHTLMLAQGVPAHVPAGWKIGFIFCRWQEHRRLMSKVEERKLMSDFFSERKHERAEENELLQGRLENLRLGVNFLGDKEFVGGGVLDSLNFAKQDERAPPPKTRSGTVTQAMLAKVTSQKKAKELSDKADAAYEILGGLVQGALGSMTGELAALQVVETARSYTPSRQRPESQDDGDTGRKRVPVPNTKRSHSQPRERASKSDFSSYQSDAGPESSPAPNRRVKFQDDGKEGDGDKATGLRDERLKLLARLTQLESENQILRQQQSSQSSTISSLFTSPAYSSRIAAASPKPEWL